MTPITKAAGVTIAAAAPALLDDVVDAAPADPVDDPVVIDVLLTLPVGPAVAVAEYLEHWAAPALCALMRSAGFVQALSMQGPTSVVRAACFSLLHWQPVSSGLQPTAVIALMMQDLAHSG